MRTKIFFLFIAMILLNCPSCSSPKKVEEKAPQTINEVRLTPEILANLDLKTETARLEPLDQEIGATGRVIQDPEDITFVFSSRSGVVKEILIGVGEAVRKGEILMEVGGTALRAPRSGTIIAINATEGTRVTTMQSLAALADIDPIRVVFDVYPKDMDRVRIGQPAEVYLIGHQEEIFSGRVTYL
ncbi:MAG: efflux RND transporter periplasmic adaptor subunit, partial [Candidatus Omnitrophota bacterium]